jgi:hypothetical protein
MESEILNLLSFAPHWNGTICGPEVEIPGVGLRPATFMVFCIIQPTRERAEWALYQGVREAMETMGLPYDEDEWTVAALYASAEAN